MYVYIVVTDSDHLGRAADQVFYDLDEAKERRRVVDENPTEGEAYIVRREIQGPDTDDDRPVPVSLIPKQPYQ